MRCALPFVSGLVVFGWMAAACGSSVDFDPESGESGAGASSTGAGASTGSTGAGASTGSTGTGGWTGSTGTGAGTGSTGTGGWTGSTGTGGWTGSTGTSTGTGAGGQGGGEVCPAYGEPCTECLSQACPDVWCGCYENQECLDLFTCTGACSTEQCSQDCLPAHQGGISDALLVSNCAGTICNAACGWGDDFDPCTVCILESCEAEMNACMAHPECMALYQCLQGCASIDLACQQDCYADHGGGVPTLQTMLECATDKCQPDC